MNDDSIGGAKPGECLGEMLSRIEEASETTMWLAARAEYARESSLEDWLKRWRRYPAAQRAAAAQEMRDYAIKLGQKLLEASVTADYDLSRARAEAMPNRVRRLDASASACADLAALLDALAIDADAADTLDPPEGPGA